MIEHISMYYVGIRIGGYKVVILLTSHTPMGAIS